MPMPKVIFLLCFLILLTSVACDPQKQDERMNSLGSGRKTTEGGYRGTQAEASETRPSL